MNKVSLHILDHPALPLHQQGCGCPSAVTKCRNRYLPEAEIQEVPVGGLETDINTCLNSNQFQVVRSAMKEVRPAI